MKRPEQESGRIVEKYRRLIEPLVGMGELRDSLLGKLEVALGVDIALPDKVQRRIERKIRDNPIDYDSFPCAPALAKRIKNVLERGLGIATYGSLIEYGEENLGNVKGIGKTSRRVISLHLKGLGVYK